MLLDPALITARVTNILEKLPVRYLIGGSLASTLHGMIRTTQDSDIVAELQPRKLFQSRCFYPENEAIY